MSTALRIAAVTQVLKDILNDGLINNDVSGITQNNINVTSLPPDKVVSDNSPETSQLNIYMYQATHNQSWRNAALPSRNESGERLSNPPLALDLHYLLTAYGASELHTDILLGMGMLCLHEIPVLSRDQIRIATGSVQVENSGGNLPDYLRFLSQARLADQVESIKITPETLSIEDISKLWAAFGTKYRPTAAYKVTAVLIEGEKPIKPALPVRQRNIYVHPIKTPLVEKIFSQSAPDKPFLENQNILARYRISIRGHELLNEKVEVNIDNEKVDAVSSNQISANNEIIFTLPDELSAGIHELTVVHPVMMGSPLAPHKGVSSKPLLFTLSPAVQGTPTLGNRTADANGNINGVIHAIVQPKVLPEQNVHILLNEMTNSTAAKAYKFPIDPNSFGNPKIAVNNISFNITEVKPASYFIRIQVDSARSPLETDSNEKYIAPVISI